MCHLLGLSQTVSPQVHIEHDNFCNRGGKKGFTTIKVNPHPRLKQICCPREDLFLFKSKLKETILLCWFEVCMFCEKSSNCYTMGITYIHEKNYLNLLLEIHVASLCTQNFFNNLPQHNKFLPPNLNISFLWLFGQSPTWFHSESHSWYSSLEVAVQQLLFYLEVIVT